MSEGFTLTSPKDIAMFRAMSLKGALRLELFGLKRSRHLPSAFSILKTEYGYKGTKKQVLDKVDFDIKNDTVPETEEAKHGL